MRNTVRFKSGTGIVNRALIFGAFGGIKLGLDLAGPSPALQVHFLVPISLKPPFSLLVILVLPPTFLEIGAVWRRRKQTQEGGEGQVVVARQEHVLLARVLGRQRYEEVEDLAGVGPAVAVVAEEDDDGGLEGPAADVGLEVGPEV